MKTPYGYQLKNGEIVLDPDAAETVKTIFQDYIKGLSAGKIANELNTGGVKTLSGNGRWHPQSVMTVLKNPVYTGQEPFTAIIEVKTFADVSDRIAPPPPRLKEIGLEFEPLQDIIICGACGRKFKKYHRLKNGTQTWLCRGYSTKNRDCKTTYREDILRRHLIVLMEKITKDHSMLTIRPKAYIEEPTAKFKLLDYQIKKALREQEYDPDALISQIFNRAQEEYKSIVIDDFEEETRELLLLMAERPASAGDLTTLAAKAMDEIQIHQDKIIFTFCNKVSFTVPLL